MSYSHYTVCACVSVMMLPWILGDRLLNSDQCFRSFVYRDETLLECMPCVFCFLHIRQTSVSVFRDDAVSEEQVCFHSNQGRNSNPPLALSIPPSPSLLVAYHWPVAHAQV